MPRFIPLLLFLLLLLTACGPFSLSKPETIEEKIRYAEQSARGNHLEDARKTWEEIRDAYVSPELTALAEIKIAEIYFVQEEFIEAGAAYEAFLKNHPTSSRAEDVLFRLGVCYERQMLGPERDQGFTRKARDIFRQYIERYPDNPRRRYAEELIQRCNNRLAAHEVTVAQYYLRRGNYDAAIARLYYVLDNYPYFPERSQIQDLLEQAENRGFGETKVGRLMDRLYQMVLKNEAVRDLQGNIMGIFAPI